MTASLFRPDQERSEMVRQTSARIITNVLAATDGKTEMDRLLALGGACPFSSRGDKEIWIAEVHRQMGTEAS